MLDQRRGQTRTWRAGSVTVDVDGAETERLQELAVAQPQWERLFQEEVNMISGSGCVVVGG